MELSVGYQYGMKALEEYFCHNVSLLFQPTGRIELAITGSQDFLSQMCNRKGKGMGRRVQAHIV